MKQKKRSPMFYEAKKVFTDVFEKSVRRPVTK